MDALTESIVAALRRDGRASYSSLARDLGTSRENVAGRVQALLTQGRLRFVTGIHPLVAGLPVSAHLAFRVSGATGTVIDALEKFAGLGFISESTGSHQISAQAWLASMRELQTLLMALRAIPEVQDVEVHLYEQVLDSFFGGRTPGEKRPSLDDVDISIMAALQRNGRAPFAEIAQEVGLSISGCRSRTMRLIDSGVLKIGAVNQRGDMDSEFLFGIGLNTNFECLHAQELLQADPGLEFLARSLGRFDLIATVGFGSLRRYNALVQKLRDLPSVGHVETWLHVRIAREEYDLAAVSVGEGGGPPVQGGP